MTRSSGHFSLRRITRAVFVTGALCAGTLAAFTVSAETLRWASAGDFLTFDIHAQNETLNSAANAAVYEGLVRLDEKMAVEPALATSWERVPEGFLFTIREGVRFHEGETLTPDDVVFSINRALLPGSQFRSTAAGILGAEKTADGKVLIRTTTGTPVILRQLASLRVLCRSWAEAHGALEPQNFIGGEESYAAKHANGTGPFKLVSRTPDVRTEFEAFDGWWDQANRKGNVTRVVYTPIASAATRTAALLSGEVDFVLDPAVQDVARLSKDPNVKILSGSEDRVMMIALDCGREVSPYVTGKDGKPLAANPLRDPRVREALSLAVNREGLVRGVMRGHGTVTGTVVSHAVDGWNEDVARVTPANPAKAKALLAEAGYPSGFRITIDTPNNRWVNDEAMVKAVASMWGRIGVETAVRAMPRAQYFPKVLSFDISAALVGWSSSTFDAYRPLQSLSATFNPKTGDGISNVGRVSSPAMDAALQKLAVEENAEARTKLAREALAIERAEFLHVPLLEQHLSWAMRKGVTAVLRPDNVLVMERVTVEPAK
ncbi:MAG: ABC transporter substrate-binding protein [Sutterella sp.]|nr:ABC transporter substrate-binding protein [Sutterella sp.]